MALVSLGNDMYRRMSGYKRSRPSSYNDNVPMYAAGPGRAYSRRRFTKRRRAYVPRSFGNPMAITERKYFDSQLANTTIQNSTTDWNNTEDDPTTLNTLFAPILGDDFNNRTGRNVRLLSVKVRGEIRYAVQTGQSTVDITPKIRVILYLDKQTNGVQAQGEDLIQSGSSTAPSIDMFQNVNNFGRFKVLRDKSMSLTQPNLVAATAAGNTIIQGANVRSFEFTYNWRKGLVIHFNNTNGGTVADIVDNSLHIIANCTDNALASQINYKCRCCFLDL